MLSVYKKAESSGRRIANIHWIDILLKENPLADFRKFVCHWILSRYMINVRRLTPEESYSAIMDWLRKCNRIQQLSPSLHEFERRVKYDITEALRCGKAPIGKQLLKVMNKELHAILFPEEKLTTH